MQQRNMWLALLALCALLGASVLLLDCLFLNPRDHRLSPYEHDAELGWIPKRNFSRNFHQRDAAGNKYDALLTLDQHRFRAYGSPATGKTKILLLGDSYTGDPFTGNKEMYFSVMQAALRDTYHKEVEIFAAGGGGYGTLQEFLLIKDQIKTISPDIFVLQFSDNDFINNLYDWESPGIVRNQSFFRPYYSEKTGGSFHSDSLYARTYRFVYKHSYLFRRLDLIIQRLQYKYYNDYSRKFTADEMKAFHLKSHEVTRKLLTLLKNEFPEKTRLFIMLDPTDDKDLNQLQLQLARETGFTPLSFPVENLNRYEAEHKSAVLRHADGGHLNIAGNKILGEGLAQDLSRHLGWQN